ncbi:hypothetical protein [Micromonospora sp. NPDC050200]
MLPGATGSAGACSRPVGAFLVYAPSSCIDWGGIVGDKYIRMIRWDDHCG